MTNLAADMNNLKKKYREIFLKSSEEIQHQIEKLKPIGACKKCKATNCDSKEDARTEIFESFPSDCEYKIWQKDVLNLLNDGISKNIYEKWMKILDYRQNYKCSGCATCCKLACSEFSYDQLKQKAADGDNFATQFISIFIPYSSNDEAREIYPDYFELLAEKLDNEDVYFYHCPKLNDENRCSDYENRQQICRDFPDNPLSFLPLACGYASWKDEVEPTSLMLHSMLEIIDFYKGRIPD